MRFRTLLSLAAALPIALGQARAQGRDTVSVAAAALTFVLRDLPKGPLVIDAGPLRTEPRLADSIAHRFEGRRDSLANVVHCIERRPRHPHCTIREGALVLAIGTPMVSGQSATIDITWWSQEAPGVVDHRWHTLQLSRTESGNWAVTKELVRGRQ